MSLIVALDYPELGPCEKLLGELKGLVKIYKVGSELFTAHGWRAVELVQKSGAEVFLDLKFHDIPTTVAKASRVVAERGLFMFNVHASGGVEMMREAKKAVDEAGKKNRKPLLLAVTVLTSLDGRILAKELGIGRSVKDQVLALAQLAKEAGLDGVVSSPEETEFLRKELGNQFLLVTPGIRLAENQADDQRRTLTPREAVQRGANYIVVGRPITAAPDPRQATRDILQSLA